MQFGILVIDTETNTPVGTMARRGGRWLWPGVDAELDRRPVDGQTFKHLVARDIQPAYEGQGTLERIVGEPAYDTETGAVTQRVERYDPSPPSAEAVATARRLAIDARLAQIDGQAIRALRAIAAGTDVADDRDRLTTIEAEAAALRTERAGLAG